MPDHPPTQFTPGLNTLRKLLDAKQLYNTLYYSCLVVFDRILQGKEELMEEFFKLYFELEETKKRVLKLTEELDTDENMRFLSNKMKEEGDYGVEKNKEELEYKFGKDSGVE
jgi:Skp family chaperone for outer membrane proteins